MRSASNPPEFDVTILENKSLPKNSIPWNQLQIPIDILIVTVKDCEFLACISTLNADFYKYYRENLGQVYVADVGNDGMQKQKIAVFKCGNGPGGCVISVKNAVEVLRPKAVFNVGFCGSLDEGKAKLGDVVVSAKLITYAPTKSTASGVQERGVSVPPKRKFANLIPSVGDGWEAPLKNRGELYVRVIRDGVFLSGPEEVANSQRRDKLCERFPQAIAIETQGEGLYAAAHDLDVEWIIVKGVANYADERELDEDSWQRFASVMAASLTAEILSDAYIFENWTHYGSDRVPQVPSNQSTITPRAEPSTAASSVRVSVKPGQPTSTELEELAGEVVDKWQKLARRLEFSEAQIYTFDKENEDLSEKGYKMLLTWMRRDGSDATYRVLYDALCHPLIGCNNLARKYCCTV